MTDLNASLAAHAAGFDASTLAPEVASHLCLDLADTLAAAIGGSRAPGVSETLAVISRYSPAGSATVFGRKGGLPSLQAAQVNGTAAHALDFDDTLDEGGGMHAGAAVHSAALAVADELGGVSGSEYLSAVAVGLDVAVRLALAPTQDFGWHRTSAFGVFGVTVAVGRLLKLDKARFAHALGIAYSQASGNRQCIPDGAMTKRLQSGFSARDGITAVLLAREGLTGATHAFERRDGFFNLYQRGAYRRETVLEGLGERLLSQRISTKPYPCGRGEHAFIDAALAIRAEHGADGIVAVRLHVAPEVAARARTSFPAHVIEAQFSKLFAVALGLATGGSSLKAFDQPETVDPAVRELFSKGRFIALEEGRRSAAVEVEYAAGKIVRRETAVARGNPANPLSSSDIERKFLDCDDFAGGPLGPERVRKVVQTALGLGRLGSTRELTSLLAARNDL